jgi:hypothetical protein
MHPPNQTGQPRFQKYPRVELYFAQSYRAAEKKSRILLSVRHYSAEHIRWRFAWRHRSDADMLGPKLSTSAQRPVPLVAANLLILALWVYLV